MQGPFEIEVKVHIGVGENRGVVTFALPAGKYPDRAAVDEAMSKALAGAKEQLGDEVRLLSRPDFQQIIIEDRIGVVGTRFASPDEWDA